MSELITAAQIIAGTGAAGWLADKLLTPSIEGLGEQFKAYASARLAQIFGAASEKVRAEDVRSLPPGFALTFLQSASFSEEDEALSDMWANLLAAAATKFESRQTAYVSILSQLAGSDARVLNEILPVGLERMYAGVTATNARTEMRVRLANQINNISPDRVSGHQEIERLLHLDLGLPGRVNSARVYFVEGSENRVLSGGREDQSLEQANLIRLGLCERFEVSNSLTHMDVGFEGVLLTALGLKFLQSCRLNR